MAESLTCTTVRLKITTFSIRELDYSSPTWKQHMDPVLIR